MVEAYSSGEKIADLARRFGVGQTTVKSHLRRLAVPGRPHRELHGERLAQAVRLYEECMSLRAISAELGVGREAVRGALIRAGVVMR